MKSYLSKSTNANKKNNLYLSQKSTFKKNRHEISCLITGGCWDTTCEKYVQLTNSNSFGRKSQDSQLRDNIGDDLNFERNVVSRAELGEVMSLRLSHCSKLFEGLHTLIVTNLLVLLHCQVESLPDFLRVFSFVFSVVLTNQSISKTGIGSR